MTKLPRFIIGDNPLAINERIFITHTREPYFVAEVFHFDIDDTEDQMKAKAAFKLGSSLEYEDEYIVIGVMQLLEKRPHTRDQLAKIMSRTGDWYHALLIPEAFDKADAAGEILASKFRYKEAYQNTLRYEIDTLKQETRNLYHIMNDYLRSVFY